MSSDPMSDDEKPGIDDATLSDVVRRPTRTAGDLSEGADASAGPTLEELLLQVRRMENEIIALKERVGKIERSIRSSPVSRDIHGQGPVEHAKSPTAPKRIGPGVPEPKLLKQDRPSEGRT